MVITAAMKICSPSHSTKPLPPNATHAAWVYTTSSQVLSTHSRTSTAISKTRSNPRAQLSPQFTKQSCSWKPSNQFGEITFTTVRFYVRYWAVPMWNLKTIIYVRLSFQQEITICHLKNKPKFQILNPIRVQDTLSEQAKPQNTQGDFLVPSCNL